MSYPGRQDSRYPESGLRDPFAEIDAIRRRLDQLYLDLSGQPRIVEWTGEVDTQETEEGWVLEAPLPGVPPEAVDIELTDRELSIQGETPASRSQDSGNGQPRRRFSYRLALPGEIDADDAEASLRHGVVTVRLPRSRRIISRKVPLSTASNVRDPGVIADPAGDGHAVASAETQPTEPLPRPRSFTPEPRKDTDQLSAGGPQSVEGAPDLDTPEVDGLSHEALEPTTGPPYQEPEYAGHPDDSALNHSGEAQQPYQSWLDWFSNDGTRPT